MVDDVDIKNVGGKYGVASEATLAALLDAMTRGGAGGSNRAARAETLAREENTRATKKEAGEKTIASIAYKATLKPIFNLTREFIAGGNRMGDFTQAVFGANSGITSLVRSLDNTIDTFRQMTSVGAGFNNSIYDFMKTSAMTGLSMTELSEFIMKNSTSLAALGGTVTEGAKRFGDISKILRRDFGSQLTRVGMSMSEMNDVLLQYTEFSIGQMGKETRSNYQLAKGAAQYSLELDKLSKLTGISRKQLADEQLRKLEDQRVRIAESQSPGLAAGLTYVDTYSTMLGDTLRDMIDGIPRDEMTKGMMLMSQTFYDKSAEFKNMSIEDQMEFSSQVAREVDEFAIANAKIIDNLRDNPLYAGLAVGAQFKSQSDMTPAERARALFEQNQYNRLSQTLLNFENALNNLKNFITLEIIGSDAFKALEDLGIQLVNSFSELFGDGKGSTKQATDSFKMMTDALIGENGLITKGILALQTELATFTEHIKNDGSFMDYFTEKVGDLGSAMSKWFKELFYGSDKLVRTPVGEQEVHQRGLLAQMGDGMVSAFTSFWEGPYGSAMADTISGYFEKLVDGIILGINSATGGLFFGGAASNILLNQAQDGKVLTPEQKSIIAEQQYEDRTSLVDQGIAGALSGILTVTDYGLDKLYSGIAALGGPLLDANAAGMFYDWTRGEAQIPPVSPQNPLPERSVGTLSATGMKFEPKDTVAQIHKGERVLNASETMSYNNGGNQRQVEIKIDQLNSTMLMVLGELRKGTDLEKRTLRSVKGLSGDLYRGI